jgi:hypothetical protein
MSQCINSKITITEDNKIKYSRDYTEEANREQKKVDKFEIDKEYLQGICSNFDKTVRGMIKNYKKLGGEIWKTIKNSSINPLGLRCLPYICSNLKFHRIEKIISLVDDKGNHHFSY